jgi:hypothetical protein
MSVLIFVKFCCLIQWLQGPLVAYLATQRQHDKQCTIMLTTIMLVKTE